MANLIRSAKSGSDWSEYDFNSFNIQVVEKDVYTFFNLSELPTPAVSETLLTSSDAPDGISKQEDDFFTYMEDALWIPPDEESLLVIDFAVVLLRLPRYDVPRKGRRVIHSHREIRFCMSGTRVDAKADVVVAKRYGSQLQYLLLIQEDKVRLPPFEV
jgi:hypothetical protein